MQRVEDFSELFRLKQSRQKKRKASHEEAVLTHLLARLFTNKSPSSSRERKKNEEETDRKPFPRFPRTPTGPGGRSTAVKSG